MKAKIINNETKEVSVAFGSKYPTDYTEMEVEQAYNGAWYLKGYAPEKPVEKKQAEVRAERERRIDAIRWRIERYQTQEAAGIETTETAEQYQALLMYIQDLRDVPEQDGFPDNVVWPDKPE